MFTPQINRYISIIVLTTFGSMTMQPVYAAAAQGGAGDQASNKGSAKGDKRKASTSLTPLTPQTLQPLQGVATSGRQQQAAIAASRTPIQRSKTERYGKGLDGMRELLERAEAKESRGERDDAEIKQLRSTKLELEAMEIEVAADFTATEQHLKNNRLPPAILARQQAAFLEFKTKQAELKQKLQAIEDADVANNKTQRQLKVRELSAFMKANQHHKKHSPADANKLQFRTPDGKVRAPKETERAFKTSLFKPDPLLGMLAGPIPNGFTLPATTLPATPTPEDLAATEDIVLTPAIKAQAAALGNNPVQIYNWVRNNVEYLPTYGSIQGADMTLQTKRGNSFDTASLLIGLLRAAGVPARYVYGTIEVPADQAMNWVGGVTTPEAVLQLMGQGGIPSIGVSAGGTIKSIKLEHVWAEAWVDYVPSRGAVNKVGDTWVPMDASYKLASEKPGLNLQGAISLNAQGVLDAGKQGAICTSDSAQGLNGTNLQSAYTDYKNRLAAYLAQQGTDLTVGDVLGSKTIDQKKHPILLGTLPYTTVAVGSELAVLPDNLRWKMNYALYAGAIERAQNLSAVSFSASLPSVLGKRLTLSFTPATQADIDALAAYMPKPHANGTPIQPGEFPADIPAYLIHVKAEISADGQVIAVGGDFVLGTQLTATTGLFVPANNTWDNSDHDVNAGEYHALAIDGQGIAASQLNALNSAVTSAKTALDAGQYATLNRDGVAGLLLQQAALGYFALADLNTNIFQRASGVVDVRLPSYARAIAKVEPQFALGIIVKASFPGVSLSVDRYQHAAASKQTGAVAAYNRQSMERASAYSHLVLENLFTDTLHTGQGISAVNALATATAQNQAVRLVTPANAAAVVPLLQIDAASKIEIQNAATAGKQILAEDGILAVDGWSGSGYIVEDTQVGMGNYRLSGNVSGVLYPMGRMGWLALGSPAQSAASVSYALGNGASFDSLAAAVLDGMDGTRWQFFPAQSEVMNGLFLSNLNALQPTSACDALAAVIASALGASSGIGSGTTGAIANHPPVILSNTIANGSAGVAYRYALQASDPDGDMLTYGIVSGPSGLKIDAAGVVTWAAPLEGVYSVTLRVDDGKAFTDQSYELVVGKGGLLLDLSLSINPKVANAGDIVTVSVVTTGGTGTSTRSLTVDGVAVALGANGQATLTAGAMGAHRVVATAADTQTTLTKEDVYSVRNPADTTPPTAQITAPIQDGELAAPVDIIGTASDANLAYYQYLLRPAGAPDTAWTEIGRGYQSIANGKLGRLDTSVLNNGLYDLALIVTDINGQQSSTVVTVEIYRDLKIGQFSISFLDLDINASGIPIRVTRTYDTLRKAQKLDFGYGWSVDYQSLQIRKNMVLGLQWDVIANPKQFTLCLRPAGKRKVAITLPTGKTERFTAANATDCAFGQIPPVDVRFTAQNGTTSTLEIVNIPNLIAQGGQLFDMDNLVTWNPTDFKLTTEDGYIYYLTEGVGIVKIVDPYGNTLTYGANGILHSNGQSVAFTRDAQGRITAITDPQGKTIAYAYDANGNLVSVTNRIKEVSRYGYNRDHGLTSYTDPSGTVLARYAYDAQGRLISVTDASGKAIQTAHDTANNREVVTDRLGRRTTYTYDTGGNVTEILDALGHRATYAYDALGNETSVTDPLGNVTTRTFDPVTAKQLSEADPLGNTTRDAYDITLKTQLNSTTDKNGNVTSYAYFRGAPNAITEPLGRSSSMGYDTKGNLTSLNIAGQASGNTYDAKGNRTSETDALGNVTSYTYDANGRELSRTWQRTNASGVKVSVTTSRTYDAEGRVVAETDALGGVTKTTWNTAGKVTGSTDPQGRTTTYAYDAQARLIKTTYPDNTSETVSYDAEGNQIAVTDRAGRSTRMEYDAKNRLTRTIHPDGTADTTVYDAAGRTDSTRDANGNPITNRYDAAGRLVASTDALNHITSFTYDANGNRTGMTDAAGKITSYTYDALNRLTKTTYPDGASKTVVYLANGRKSSETDQNGNSVAYGYDTLGRINKVTLTSNGVAAVTSYGYDEAGNKTSQTDAQGRITKWAYDNANRVVGRTLPNGETESWQYDQAGNRIAHTDFAGKKTSYTVDANGRTLFVIDANGNTVGYLYSASGQVAGITDNRGTTKYTYDAKDRLTRQDNPDGSFLAYAYDANGNVTERSTPAGTARYAYDKLNRLTTVTGLDGKQTGYQYDANGNRIRTLNANGTDANYSYDALNRLTAIEHRQANGSILRGYAYTLKPNGQRAQVREYDAAGTVRTRDYTYDALNRLTQDTLTDARTAANSRTTVYAYGNTGNRTSKTETQGGVTTTTAYVYDADDRLTSETRTQGATTQATTYGWNANGNLTQKIEAAQTTLYTWDSYNRLIEVKRGTTAATATSVAAYQYDANGNRVGKTTVSGQKIAYLVDSNLPYAQVAEEKITLGAVTDTTTYLYGIERIQQTRAGQGTYYHGDGLGSTRLLTDATGNLTDSYDYDDYGALQSQTGTTKNDFLYAGEQFDAEAGLYYNRARHLDTNTGRFTGLDPFEGNLSRPITLNKYAYAGNDPVNATDPSGLFTLGDTMGAVNSSMNMASMAMDMYDYLSSKFAPNEDVDEIDGPPTLWDSLVASLVKAVASVAAGSVPQVVGAVAPGATRRHHTIPEYMCGAKAQEQVILPFLDHVKLHNDLYKFEVGVKVASVAYNLLFRKKQRMEIRSPIAQIARTPYGRQAIIAGLSMYYQDSGFGNMGRGEDSGRNLYYVFFKESLRYAGSHHSYPACKK
jgi:RHS repeat-associated protein